MSAQDKISAARAAEYEEARVAREIEDLAAARAARERLYLDAIQAQGLLRDLAAMALEDGRHQDLVDLARYAVRAIRGAQAQKR